MAVVFMLFAFGDRRHSIAAAAALCGSCRVVVVSSDGFRFVYHAHCFHALFSLVVLVLLIYCSFHRVAVWALRTCSEDPDVPCLAR